MNPFVSLRKRLGISQSDLGKRLEVSQASISQYESGNTLPPAVVAASFIKFAKSKGMKVSFDDIYGAAVGKKGAPKVPATEEVKG